MNNGNASAMSKRVGERLYRTVRDNLPMVLLVGANVFLGFAFNWGLAYAGSSAPWSSDGLIFQSYVEGGEIVGFCLMAIAAATGTSLAGSCVAAGVGMVVGMAGMLSPIGVFANGGSAVFGCGYAMLLTEYLTAASRLVPRKTLSVIAVILVSAFISFPLTTELDSAGGSLYAIAATAGSVLCLLMAAEALPPLAKALGKGVAGPLVAHKRLVAFAIGVPLAYGFCTSYLAIGPSSFGFAVGYMIPGVVVLAGLVLFYNRFSLLTVYAIGYPMMVLGLLLSFFLGLPSFWAKVLISASLSSAYILIYMMARLCGRTEAAFTFSYAVLTLLITLFVTIGKEVGSFFVPLEIDSAVAVALVMIAVLSFGLVMPRTQGAETPDVNDPLFDASMRHDALTLAHEHGLSERETAVYVLLVSGKGIGDISEELFIAPSTVRAHASRIYEKFGVHDREGLAAASR